MYRGADFTMRPPDRKTLRLLYRYWRYRFSVWWRRKVYYCPKCGFDRFYMHSAWCPIKWPIQDGEE